MAKSSRNRKAWAHRQSPAKKKEFKIDVDTSKPSTGSEAIKIWMDKHYPPLPEGCDPAVDGKDEKTSLMDPELYKKALAYSRHNIAPVNATQADTVSGYITAASGTISSSKIGSGGGGYITYDEMYKTYDKDWQPPAIERKFSDEKAAKLAEAVELLIKAGVFEAEYYQKLKIHPQIAEHMSEAAKETLEFPKAEDAVKVLQPKRNVKFVTSVSSDFGIGNPITIPTEQWNVEYDRNDGWTILSHEKPNE